MTAKAVHSIRMCLTVQVVWKIKHCDRFEKKSKDMSYLIHQISKNLEFFFSQIVSKY